MFDSGNVGRGLVDWSPKENHGENDASAWLPVGWWTVFAVSFPQHLPGFVWVDVSLNSHQFFPFQILCLRTLTHSKGEGSALIPEPLHCHTTSCRVGRSAHRTKNRQMIIRVLVVWGKGTGTTRRCPTWPHTSDFKQWMIRCSLSKPDQKSGKHHREGACRGGSTGSIRFNSYSEERPCIQNHHVRLLAANLVGGFNPSEKY